MNSLELSLINYLFRMIRLTFGLHQALIFHREEKKKIHFLVWRVSHECFTGIWHNFGASARVNKLRTEFYGNSSEIKRLSMDFQKNLPRSDRYLQNKYFVIELRNEIKYFVIAFHGFANKS